MRIAHISHIRSTAHPVFQSQFRVVAALLNNIGTFQCPLCKNESIELNQHLSTQMFCWRYWVYTVSCSAKVRQVRQSLFRVTDGNVRSRAVTGNTCTWRAEMRTHAYSQLIVKSVCMAHLDGRHCNRYLCAHRYTSYKSILFRVSVCIRFLVPQVSVKLRGKICC